MPAAVGALLAGQPVVRGARLVVAAAEVERHRRLDQVPRVGVAARGPRDVAVGELDATRWRRPSPRAARAVTMPSTSGAGGRGSSASAPPSACRRPGSCRAPGSACGRAWPTHRGWRSIWYTRKSWYLRTGHASGLSRPTAHFSHQYGECSACAWSRTAQQQAGPARASLRARAGGRCGCGRRACRGSGG